MSTEVGIWIFGDHPLATSALEETQSWVERAEQTLSRFREDSELSGLNRAAGRGPKKVSSLLLASVGSALSLAHRSQGLVDPTVLSALVRAGYGPGPRCGRIDYTAVHVDTEHSTITLPAGIALDLGGFAKGWLADRLASRLAKYGSVLVDMGGDLRAVGPLVWPLGVQNPWSPQEKLLDLDLEEQGVATSSILKRNWGPGQHHLIDPRTSRPLVNDLVAATVIAPSATLAEAAAKVALLLGGQAGRRYLQKEDLRGVLFGKNGSIL
ncbi:MAG: FAD:protein FMN transferase [Vulcanimicrobiota bacterium]